MRLSRPGKKLIWFVGMFAMLTWLGFRGAGQIDPDEEVAFHGPYLYWDENDSLRLVLGGRVFEPELDSSVRHAAIDRVIGPLLFRTMHKRPDDFDVASRERMVRRLQPFLADGESRVALTVRLRGAGGDPTRRLRRTGAGGYFADEFSDAAGRTLQAIIGDGGELQLEAVLPPGDSRRMCVSLAVPRRRLPLLVVSDVDDTVRIAEVTNRPRLIERVFLHEYEAVADMARVYNELARGGAAFHFVSGSPWQIGPIIERFLADAEFPPATLHCRQIGWDFWNSDPSHTFKFKVAEITELLRQFSDCPVLLIGDSGEHDPEVYTEIVSCHADRVAGIWIRQVGESWDAQRLAAATERLGSEKVVVFSAAAALLDACRKIEFSQ